MEELTTTYLIEFEFLNRHNIFFQTRESKSVIAPNFSRAIPNPVVYIKSEDGNENETDTASEGIQKSAPEEEFV